MTKTTYIAFLRGINIGGHTVKMEQLREMFGMLDLGNPQTYIQSGNVFFSTARTDRACVQQEIEQHLAQSLGYAVPVFLRTREELSQTIAVAPFAGQVPGADTRYFIVFTSAPSDVPLPYLTPKGDFEVVGRNGPDLYMISHIINGRPGNPVFLEKQFGVQSTSRFYHTTIKILAAAKAYEQILP